MIGIVNRIESATDVFVEFINGEKLHIHPELLLLATERGDFEEGDLVLVRHDLKKLIAILKGHIPDWEDGMEEVTAMEMFLSIQFSACQCAHPACIRGARHDAATSATPGNADA